MKLSLPSPSLPCPACHANPSFRLSDLRAVLGQRVRPLSGGSAFQPLPAAPLGGHCRLQRHCTPRGSSPTMEGNS